MEEKKIEKEAVEIELKDEELEKASGGKKTRHTNQQIQSDPGFGITRAG